MNNPLNITQIEPVAYAQCPNCQKRVGYYWFSGMGDLIPHFYCDRCSNLYHSKAHREVLKSSKATQELLDKLGASLPGCPCGGHFRPGQFPKCPHCEYEFRSKADSIWRLKDPYAILIEGASLVTEE